MTDSGDVMSLCKVECFLAAGTSSILLKTLWRVVNNVCVSSLLFMCYKMMVSSAPLRPPGLLAKWVHRKCRARIMQIFFSELDTPAMFSVDNKIVNLYNLRCC